MAFNNTENRQLKELKSCAEEDVRLKPSLGDENNVKRTYDINMLLLKDCGK